MLLFFPSFRQRHGTNVGASHPSLYDIQAARYGDMEEVQSYLSQGVSPDAADVEGRTALFFAAANGHLEIVDVLLEKEAVSMDDEDDDDKRTHSTTA